MFAETYTPFRFCNASPSVCTCWRSSTCFSINAVTWGSPLVWYPFYPVKPAYRFCWWLAATMISLTPYDFRAEWFSKQLRVWRLEQDMFGLCSQSYIRTYNCVFVAGSQSCKTEITGLIRCDGFIHLRELNIYLWCRLVVTGYNVSAYWKSCPDCWRNAKRLRRVKAVCNSFGIMIGFSVVWNIAQRKSVHAVCVTVSETQFTVKGKQC